MAQVLIRNVPDHVIESFKLKALIKGTSLEQYLRDYIAKGTTLTCEERAAMIDKNMARFPEPVPSMTLDEIREGLE